MRERDAIAFIAEFDVLLLSSCKRGFWLRGDPGRTGGAGATSIRFNHMRFHPLLAALVVTLALAGPARAAIVAVTVTSGNTIIGRLDVDTSIAPALPADAAGFYGYSLAALSNVQFSYAGQDFTSANIDLHVVGPGKSFALLSDVLIEAGASGDVALRFFGSGNYLFVGTAFQGGVVTGSSSFEPPSFFDRTSFSVTTSFAAVPVPEPSSIALLGAGLVGLAGLRRRRSHAAAA